LIKKFFFLFSCQLFFIIINKINNFKYKIYILNTLFYVQGLEPLKLKKKINPNKHLFSNLEYLHSKKSIEKGPLVSIIVTYYDNHNLIDHSINSLINQTFKNIQIIVVFDGCMKKNIKNIRQKFKKYDFIKFITLSKKKGNPLAKNKAIPYVRGKYVTVHDSDDIAHPQKIETYINTLSNNKNLAGIVSYWFRVNLQFQIIKSSNKLFFTRLNPTSFFFDKKTLNANKWNDMPKGNDSAFLNQEKKKLKYILNINKILTIGAFRDNSITFS
jgi:cellulose synthase/poly-beta-1,6-N-acetylglucosamine synthase-like glycosyltransferase